MDCKSFWRQDQFNGNTMHPESFKVVDHFYAEYDNNVEGRTHAIIYCLRYSNISNSPEAEVEPFTQYLSKGSGGDTGHARIIHTYHS